MASRPKRKFISACDQEQLMKEFYNQLDEDDSEFLGNQFAGEDGENNAYGSESDSDSSKEIQRDEICDVKLGNGQEEELENEVKRKEKFRNLDKVLD